MAIIQETERWRVPADAQNNNQQSRAFANAIARLFGVEADSVEPDAGGLLI